MFDTVPATDEPPANVTVHARATVGAANDLGILVTTPTVNGKYPRGVEIQNESASANTLFWTTDNSTPSATNGIELGKGVSRIFYCPTLIANVRNGASSASNPQIKLYSAGASAQIRWIF